MSLGRLKVRDNGNIWYTVSGLKIPFQQANKKKYDLSQIKFVQVVSEREGSLTGTMYREKAIESGHILCGNESLLHQLLDRQEKGFQDIPSKYRQSHVLVFPEIVVKIDSGGLSHSFICLFWSKPQQLWRAQFKAVHLYFGPKFLTPVLR